MQQNQALINAINKISGADELVTENKRTAVANIKETMELVNKCESDIKQFKSDSNNKQKRHPNNCTKVGTINRHTPVLGGIVRYVFEGCANVQFVPYSNYMNELLKYFWFERQNKEENNCR